MTTETTDGPGRLAMAALVAATSATATLLPTLWLARGPAEHVFALAVLAASFAIQLVAALVLGLACGLRELRRGRGRSGRSAWSGPHPGTGRSLP